MHTLVSKNISSKRGQYNIHLIEQNLTDIVILPMEMLGDFNFKSLNNILKDFKSIIIENYAEIFEPVHDTDSYLFSLKNFIDSSAKNQPQVTFINICTIFNADLSPNYPLLENFQDATNISPFQPKNDPKVELIFTENKTDVISSFLFIIL